MAASSARDGWDIRGISENGRQVVIHRLGVGSRLVDVETGDSIDLPLFLSVNVARFSPDGSLVSLNTETGSIPIVSTESGETVAVIAETADAPNGMWHEYSPDGALLAVGGFEGELLVYDLEALEDGVDQADALQTRIDAHDDFIVPLAFSPDGTLIATTARGDEPARIWRVDTGELVAELGPDARTPVAFHPTEPWVYVGEGTMITRHTLDLDELIEIAKVNLTRTFTDEECRLYLQRACPSSALER